MPSQGANSPSSATTSVAGGTQAWLGELNTFVADSNLATVSGDPGIATTSHRLEVSGFGFTIPTAAAIDGILVEILKAGLGSSTDSSIRLLTAGSPVGDDKAQMGTPWPGSPAYTSHGSETDAWRAGLTPTEINKATFGVGIVVALPAVSSADVDHVRVTVWYSGIPDNPPTRQHMSRDIPMVFRGDHADAG